PARVGELLLHVRDFSTETREIDTDERSHTETTRPQVLITVVSYGGHDRRQPARPRRGPQRRPPPFGRRGPVRTRGLRPRPTRTRRRPERGRPGGFARAFGLARRTARSEERRVGRAGRGR